MIIGGVDTSALPAQFQNKTAGRTLIVDADGPCYAASSTARTLSMALTKFHSAMLKELYLTGSEQATLHLTSSSCHKAGRFNIIAEQPYQGRRKSSTKPPLLEALRQAVTEERNWLEEYTVVMNHMVEADDSMMIESYLRGDSGLIWSGDKDLRMTPHPYWEKKTGEVVQGHGFGRLHLDVSTTQKKCLGYGLKFFWAQMLMGDSADSITGLRTYKGKDCGAVTTFGILNPLSTETQVANRVISAYRAIDQNPIPEGWLLWLHRKKDDKFWAYLQDLTWMPENRAFLDDCVRRTWFKKPTKEDNDEPF